MQASRPFSRLNPGSHGARIVSISAQPGSSILVTASADHSLSCFDVAAGYCIASHGVVDDILCVSVHPAALLVLVALRTSLKLYEVSMCAPNCA